MSPSADAGAAKAVEGPVFYRRCANNTVTSGLSCGVASALHTARLMNNGARFRKLS